MTILSDYQPSKAYNPEFHKNIPSNIRFKLKEQVANWSDEMLYNAYDCARTFDTEDDDECLTLMLELLQEEDLA